jgi:hypothetical protein
VVAESQGAEGLEDDPQRRWHAPGLVPALQGHAGSERRRSEVSAKVRAEAEALRAKYARCFGVPVSTVTIEWTEDENAIIRHPLGPVWTLGAAQHKGDAGR